MLSLTGVIIATWSPADSIELEAVRDMAEELTFLRCPLALEG
jgi:hypothetical protein